MKIQGNEIVLFSYLSFNPKIALFSLIFIISFLMICYLLLDYIFGFSVSSALKGCKRFEKLEKYDFLQSVYDDVKEKFGCPDLKLYIKKTDEINAFAIAGMRKKSIVLTTGLINHYLINIPDNEKFLRAIRSIMGHEMSHLINKDFLPGLLMIVNQKVTNFATAVILILFKICLQIFAKLNMQSTYIARIMAWIYNVSSWILHLFSRVVIYNLYNFLKKFFSRQIEYRSDRQSAKAFGGMDMAFSLSLLGKSGYLTLFSTHPSTSRRIRKVEVVEEKNAVIRPSFLSSLSNFISIMILPLICYYAARISNIDLMIKYYIFHYYPDFYYQVVRLWAGINQQISVWFSLVKTMYQ